jgi:hypothetical protein
MLVLIVATACAGLFAGAAIYITAVEHPARLASGTEVAFKQFAPSSRATMMQASLAIAGCAAGLWAAWSLQDLSVTIGSVSRCRSSVHARGDSANEQATVGSCPQPSWRAECGSLSTTRAAIG